MTTFCTSSRTSRIRFSNIDDLQSDIVGNGADERGVERVVLDIVNDRVMMGIRSSRLESLVVLGVCGQVPR